VFRPFFLHSAAVDWRGSACLLAAESGSGKSTTTWGLLHHKFHYLSDELSPIDLGSMQVFSYPRALCLKRPLAPAYGLPPGALDLGRTIHIPAQSLPSATVSESRPLGAVFVAAHRPDLSRPNIRATSPAEASARSYVVALNALAHPNRGLDAVIRISETVPCFALSAAELSAICALICSTVERMILALSSAESEALDSFVVQIHGSTQPLAKSRGQWQLGSRRGIQLASW
jgi:hypothetical protein